MTIEHQLEVPRELATQRIDQAVASLLPQYSRAKLQAWIRSGQLTVDGELVRQKDKVCGGEEVTISAEEASLQAEPQDIPLAVLHEDDSLLVINKPPSLVVHPGAGNPDGTIMNALLHRDAKAALMPRAGIVHRLDKDTSGLLVVARTASVQLQLIAMLQEHEVSRHYDALVHGVPARKTGSVEAPIGRHKVRRTLMTVRPDGKPAVTHYEVRATFPDASAALLECRLETGRTHQIRVHMQSIGHPLIGDATYGGGAGTGKRSKAPKDLAAKLLAFPRQALHARALAFRHPVTGEAMRFAAPAPDDFASLLEFLPQKQ